MVKEYDARFQKITHETDIALLQRTFEIARESVAAGNHPFGALLADADGNILLEQGNTVVTRRNGTRHAEIILAMAAADTYSPEFLWNCSLYTSAEPCCMCAGGVFWANIGRLVYAISEHDLFCVSGNDNPSFDSACRKVLNTGGRDIVVCGPFEELREEALRSHRDFW